MSANPVPTVPSRPSRPERCIEPAVEQLQSCGPEVALLPFLDRDGVDQALKFILSNWPNNAPMTADVRDTWLGILPLLRQGELRKALGRRTDDKSHRPQPYALLEIVESMRAEVSAGTRLARAEESTRKIKDLNAERAQGFDVNAFVGGLLTKHRLPIITSGKVPYGAKTAYPCTTMAGQDEDGTCIRCGWKPDEHGKSA